MKMCASKNSLEYQVVCSLARVDLNDAAKARLLSILTKPLHWQRIEKIASNHGVGGLLYQNLLSFRHEHELRSVDLSHLENIYYGNIAKALMTEHALCSLLKVFNNERIPLLIYKGIELVERVYRNPGLRGFADVDFMVPGKDIFRVQEILRALGYLNPPNHPDLFSNGTVDIDLHTEPFGCSRIEARRFAFGFDSATLWEHALRQNFLGYSVHNFSLEHELLVLTAHIVKHSFQKIIWFVDVAELIRHYKTNIDWELCVDKILRSGLQQPFNTILQWANKHADVAIPAHVQPEVQPRQNCFLQNHLYKKIEAGAGVERSAELIYLFSISGFLKKLQFLKEALFLKREIRAQIFEWYNTPMFFLFYPIRLFQIVKFGFRLCFQLLLK
jgi:hypothetical protein